ncbi:MAG TPA: nuclear transport factor 2 family protein [Acidimicrobiales bacterium]|nr:nuclear transport factor 2 family protein [Acidimicrobiales bacterium]
MDTEDPTQLEILRRYQQAIVSQSADNLADLYAVDAVHEVPFLFPGIATQLEGREQVRFTYRAAWAHSDAQPQSIRETAVHCSEDGETVVAEQTVVGVLASAGQPFEFPGVVVLRVREGEIIHARDYMDGLRVAHTMGRLPAVAAALAKPDP